MQLFYAVDLVILPSLERLILTIQQFDTSNDRELYKPIILMNTMTNNSNQLNNFINFVNQLTEDSYLFFYPLKFYGDLIIECLISENIKLFKQDQLCYFYFYNTNQKIITIQCAWFLNPNGFNKTKNVTEINKNQSISYFIEKRKKYVEQMSIFLKYHLQNHTFRKTYTINDVAIKYLKKLSPIFIKNCYQENIISKITDWLSKACYLNVSIPNNHYFSDYYFAILNEEYLPINKPHYFFKNGLQFSEIDYLKIYHIKLKATLNNDLQIKFKKNNKDLMVSLNTTLTITDVDLKLIQKYYKIELIEYIDGYAFKKVKRIFKDFLHYYKSLKQNQNHQTLKYFADLLLESFYDVLNIYLFANNCLFRSLC